MAWGSKDCMGYGDGMESGNGMGFEDCKGSMMALDSEMGWDMDTWSNLQMQQTYLTSSGQKEDCA